MKSAARILLVSTTLATLVSGCSAEVPGHAKALPDLDVSKFTDKPCSLLTPSQLAQLGDFANPVPRQEPDKSACELNPHNVGRAGYLVTLRTKGISFESARDNMKGSPEYRETDIAGYPAFSYSGSDTKGICTTSVRPSDKGALQVTVVGEPEFSPELEDSCGATEKAAALVVTNLKAS